MSSRYAHRRSPQSIGGDHGWCLSTDDSWRERFWLPWLAALESGCFDGVWLPTGSGSTNGCRTHGHSRQSGDLTAFIPIIKSPKKLEHQSSNSSKSSSYSE